MVAFQFIGTGLVLPFWVVYLHEIRGFALDTTGLLLAVLPAAGFVITAPAGIMIDRFGPRRAMMASLTLACLGETTMAFATSIPAALVGLWLVGSSFGISWPAAQSMIAVVVPSEIRQRYFGMNFALLNLGIGVGGVIGGLYADVHHPVTFQVMYLVEACSYLPALVLLLGPLRHAGGAVDHEENHGEEARAGYLSVMRRPAVLAMTLLSFTAAFVGYAQLNSGLPAYARAISDVSTRALGWAFAANTLVIVALQLVVLQRIEGRRRTRVVLVMSLVWAVSWALLASSSLVPGSIGAALLVVGCMSVFAFGETMLQPTIPAMVNDLAPDHLRGRYNAITSCGFQGASIAGPPMAGVLIGHGLGLAWIVTLLAGLLLLAVVALRWVEPRLTPRANGLRLGSAEPALPVDTPVGTGLSPASAAD